MKFLSLILVLCFSFHATADEAITQPAANPQTEELSEITISPDLVKIEVATPKQTSFIVNAR